jgi:catechol 2,3-dioxygenase-like lactoylglutathione lyase family enzyme
MTGLQFVSVTTAVQDVAVSKEFYAKVLGLRVLVDDGPFVLFEGNFAIHQAQELMGTVFGEGAPRAAGPQGSNNLLVYFETDDLRSTFLRLRDQVDLVHPVERQHWGQRVFRFYDPDRHIVEIGEPMEQHPALPGTCRTPP